MAGERADPELPGEDQAHERPRWPPFLRHGLFAVAVFVVAMSAVVYGSAGDVQGPTLVAFSVGFTVFMTFYFFSMYVAWLFME
jgi:hypothetical protein